MASKRADLSQNGFISLDFGPNYISFCSFSLFQPWFGVSGTDRIFNVLFCTPQYPQNLYCVYLFSPRRASAPAMPSPPRSLEDVLRDPEADWTELRAALRTPGRGPRATTNAGLLRGLLRPGEQRSGALVDHVTAANRMRQK